MKGCAVGQVLHGCAPTTEAVRRAIQHSQKSLGRWAKRYGINQKTVAKWKKRSSVANLPTGSKAPRSTVLSIEDEAIVVAFRRHTLLPLDDCFCALQATLSQSSLHRCLQRHCISRLPEVEGDRPDKRKFKTYPIGHFHIDISDVRTHEAGSTCSWQSTGLRSSPSVNAGVKMHRLDGVENLLAVPSRPRLR